MFVSPLDFVLNGRGYGEVGSVLNDIHFDPGLLRPFLDEKGRACVLVNTGRKETRKDKSGNVIKNKQGQPVLFPVYEKRLISDLVLNHGMTKLVSNAAVLTKEQWITLTSVVVTAFRKRLRAWRDLMDEVPYGGFDGMSTMVLEYQTMSDPGDAVVDFDGMSEGPADRPQFKLEGLPLPIIHSNFWFPERMLAISRRNGTPLNTRMAEAAGRRVAEMVEKLVIGAVTGPQLGDAASGTAGIAYSRAAKVYGFTNHPSRITKTNLVAPNSTGWKPSDTLNDVLAMIELLQNKNFFGPYMIYHSTDWDKYMDGDYYALATSGMAAPTKTLRQRLREIDSVKDVRRLDFLTNTFTLIVLQITSDVVQAVNGMDVTTVQWPSMGGMRQNFKVMAIQAPLLTPDYNDNLGLCHGTTA
ncbi:MAG: hypothetical protein KatS3mg087_1198 [Patescibacteria group bacterium]|nr:MAG: hypothetical protein KatS3mg087_1198 [Patescibacteria group bacterium]